MKRLFQVFLLSLSFVVFAQPKPQKTFDHVTFAKRVYGNISAGMNTAIFLPDDNALKFISAKTGRSIEELKQEREWNTTNIQKDKGVVQEEKAAGLMVTKVDLIKVAHPTLTMANIIIVVGAGTAMKRIELGNCIQTDVTWVLGDYIALDGKKSEREKFESKEEMIAKYLAKKEKDYSQLKGREWSVLRVIIINAENPNGRLRGGAQLQREDLYHFDVQLNDNGTSQGYLTKGVNIIRKWTNTWELDADKLKFVDGNNILDQLEFVSCSKDEFIVKGEYEKSTYYFIATAAPEQKAEPVAPVITETKKPEIKPYRATLFPQEGTNLSSQFIQQSKIGLPLNGYYITNNDEKVNAIIVYQEPEKLLLQPFSLAIAKQANTTKVDYLNPDKEPNFDRFVPKDQLKAFYVGDQLFVQSTPGKWYILVTEGAIKKLVNLTKVTAGTKTGYDVSYLIQKLDATPEGQNGMLLNFKTSMSELVKENAEMALKIKNKEAGYQFMQLDKIIDSYNQWFDQQFPGKVKYLPLSAMPSTMPASGGAISTPEELGKQIINALVKDDINIIIAVTPTEAELIKTYDERLKPNAELRERMLKGVQGMDNLQRTRVPEQYNKLRNRKARITETPPGLSQVTFDTTIVWSEIKFKNFEFIKDVEKSVREGFDTGTGFLYLIYRKRTFRIRMDALNLVTGWKAVGIGSSVEHVPTR